MTYDFNWLPYKPSESWMTLNPNLSLDYIELNVSIDGKKVDALVRIKPFPHNGRMEYLWQFGKISDYAETISEAKEMVEGLVIAHHLELM